jgi:hypothetical protein
VAVICGEEGSAFADARVILASVSVDEEMALCPRCAGSLLKDFPDATASQIQAAGFGAKEYR